MNINLGKERTVVTHTKSRQNEGATKEAEKKLRVARWRNMY